MQFEYYRDAVKQLRIGKRLPDSIYVHESAFSQLPPILASLIIGSADKFSISDESWNILKLYSKDFKIAFLNYPEFESNSYPSLHLSQIINIAKQTYRKADYSKSDNPPILHRKETFVEDSYPLKSLFEAITQEGETIGLYEKTSRIGFKNNWDRLIKSKGYFLDENGRLNSLQDKLIPKSTESTFTGKVARHKTAIDRNQLSQPMRALARHNYLTGDYSVLDYGCGKGDDVRELEAHGINVTGWDPTHRPDEILANKDIVNLGFVLNVIEDCKEREETLIRAWEHADKLLIVSVMVAGESVTSQFTPYKDGVITSRHTFQKYYSQGEICYYLESSLQETVIAVGQGIFLIFKDKLEEQSFLSARQHIKRQWTQKTQRQLALKPHSINKDIVDKHSELFNDYWQTMLELGRIPANNEFDFSDQIRRICGSHNKAHQALLEYFGEDVFKESQEKRREDLIVYFALSLFEKRKPQSKIPENIKRDIKAFFTSYPDALSEAREVLFSIGDKINIGNACLAAYEKLGCGYLEERHSFTFHRDYLGELPATLRIYIGCATQLYGDIDEFQLVKVHITSGKVSLMRYNDWTKNTPLLMERIKIKMCDQDVDFFDYGGRYEPPPLINKEIFN